MSTLTPSAVAYTLSVVGPSIPRAIFLVPDLTLLEIIGVDFTIVGSKTLTPGVVAVTLTGATPALKLTVVPSVVAATGSAPSVTVAKVGVGKTYFPTAPQTRVRTQQVTLFFSQVIGPSPADASVVNVLVPSVTVVKGDLVATPDPASMTVNPVGPATVLEWIVLPEATGLAPVALEPGVAVDRILPVDPASAALSVPSVASVDFGEVTLGPGPTLGSLAVVSPSLSWGPIALSVPPTGLAASVPVPSLREGVGQPGGEFLINDGCFAYCLLTPVCFAYCTVVGEAAPITGYDFGTFANPTNNLDFNTFLVPLNNLNLGTFNAPTN